MIRVFFLFLVRLNIGQNIFKDKIKFKLLNSVCSFAYSVLQSVELCSVTQIPFKIVFVLMNNMHKTWKITELLQRFVFKIEINMISLRVIYFYFGFIGRRCRLSHDKTRLCVKLYTT